MRRIEGFDNVSGIVNPAVTVGSFDGVHEGHRSLLSLLKKTAAESGGQSVVLTFDPHPRTVLDSACGLKLLTTTGEKAALLDAFGIDNLLVIPFDRHFSALSSHEFLEKYLIGRVGARNMVVGYNHRFGHDKHGDFAYLKRLEQEYRFRVTMMPRYDVGTNKVSSTYIRHSILMGDMASANALLGYPYFVFIREGRVGEGKLLPPDGEYSATVMSVPEFSDFISSHFRGDRSSLGSSRGYRATVTVSGGRVGSELTAGDLVMIFS